jgi:hypothetical protein
MRLLSRIRKTIVFPSNEKNVSSPTLTHILLGVLILSDPYGVVLMGGGDGCYKYLTPLGSSKNPEIEYL